MRSDPIDGLEASLVRIEVDQPLLEGEKYAVDSVIAHGKTRLCRLVGSRGSESIISHSESIPQEPFIVMRTNTSRRIVEIVTVSELERLTEALHEACANPLMTFGGGE